MSKSAIYHQEAPLPDIELTVSAQNEDGTFDLSRGGELVVARVCKGTSPGTASLIVPAKSETAPDKKNSAKS